MNPAAGAGAGNVGIVGIGAMGLAMALRLRDGGHDVTVHDIDRGRETLAADAGCRVASSPAAAAAQAEVLIVAVVDGAQTHAVLFDAEGAAHTLRPGATVLLCPTIAPADVEFAAATLAARSIATLDAPMSGGPQRARLGTMSLMVAGADDIYLLCEPLLRQLSSHIFRVGTRPGDGARTKLVNNLLAAINLAGAAEAMALARQLGLDEAATLAVIEQSSGQSWIASERLHRRLAGDARVQARVALLAKDSALAIAAGAGARTGAGAGLNLPLGEQAAATFARACESGLADADDSVLFGAPPLGAAAAAPQA